MSEAISGDPSRVFSSLANCERSELATPTSEVREVSEASASERSYETVSRAQRKAERSRKPEQI